MYGGSGVLPASRQEVEHGARRLAGEHPAPVAERLVAAHAPTTRRAPRSPDARPAAGARAASASQRSSPPAERQRTQEERLDASARRPPEERARREHARVVAHQHVAGDEQLRQVDGSRRPRGAPAARRHDEQPRGVARLERVLRDRAPTAARSRGRRAHPGRAPARATGSAAARRPHPATFRASRSLHASHLLAAQPQYFCR